MESERKIWPIALTLGVVTFLIYSPVLTYGFVNYDDPQYVLNNQEVKNGLTLKGIAWAFSGRYATNWHPLTWISHMMDAELFGLNAWGHHLTNVLFHVVNTLLLFGLLQKMTRALWRSTFVAALFALHPLRVESVAWVAERKDVLSAFFFFLTLWAYVRFIQADNHKLKVKNYLLALLLFALGLLSKPMLVTLPFVLLLLDFWPLQRFTIHDSRFTIWRPIREKIPFIFLSLMFCGVTLWAQEKTIMSIHVLPMPIRIFNALTSYVRYLTKIIWPSKLAVLYPYPTYWSWPTILVAMLFLILVSRAVLQQRRQRTYLAVGWFWFLGMLVPVIGLVQVGLQSMADRYTYLPSIGIFIIIAWGVCEFFAERNYDRIILQTLGILTLVGCASLTLRQSNYWQNGERLFKHTLAVTKNNPVAHFNLGKVLLGQNSADGLSEPSLALLNRRIVDEAGEHFAEAAKLIPRFPEAQNSLANVLVLQGKREEAVSHYELALQSDSNHFVAHYNLGVTLNELGRLDEAIPHFESAVKRRPDFLVAQRDLGLALAKKKDFSGALAHLGEVTRLNPTNAEGHLFLGSVLIDAGKTNDAQNEFTAALQMNPNLLEQFKREASAASEQGELNSAADRLSAVLKSRPDDADTHRQMALVLSEQGKTELSLAQFREVARLRPKSAVAVYEVGLALVKSGNSEQAIPVYREAIRLKWDFPSALNDLAWILATHPSSNVRKGTDAVELARRACELSANSETRFLGTLDAALAETGQFEEAIRTAKQVREQAKARGETDLARAAEERLALYQAGKPFRQGKEASRESN